MNILLGLLGGFLVFGSVGGLENNTMSILEMLVCSCTGFALIFHVVMDEGWV